MESHTLLESVATPLEAGQNFEPRCPVAIVVDCSGSMSGGKIEELNRGLQQFSDEVRRDSLVALRCEPLLIQFGSRVSSNRDWKTADEFSPPKLAADGSTPLFEATIAALDAIEDRKRAYHAAALRYYRPWMLLISDGEPTDPGLEAEAIERCIDAERMSKCSNFSIGVDGADMDLLAKLSPARSPLRLQDMKFQELFRWLSSSLKSVAHSRIGQQAALPPVSGWAATP